MASFVRRQVRKVFFHMDREDGKLGVKLAEYIEEVKDIVKQTQGRRYDNETKTWLIDPEHLDDLKGRLTESNVEFEFKGGVDESVVGHYS